jgi:metal transporter CNNM
MHSSLSSHGGDLKNDTVTIIGATLDLQEKVVMQVNVSPHLSLHPFSSID